MENITICITTFKKRLELVKILINSIKNVISYNKEREEKDRLFQHKVNELKAIFEKKRE